jgi:hypothetical protein
MLHSIVHRKRAKDHQEEKKIVDAKRFFDQITREVFERGLLAVETQYTQSEQDGDADPPGAGKSGFAHADPVRAPVKHPQIKHYRDEDEKIKRDPEKRRAHGESAGALGLFPVRVDGVQIRQFHAYRLPRLNHDRNVPAQTHVA